MHHSLKEKIVMSAYRCTRGINTLGCPMIEKSFRLATRAASKHPVADQFPRTACLKNILFLEAGLLLYVGSTQSLHRSLCK